MELVAPNVKYKESFVAAAIEFGAEDHPRTNRYKELSPQELDRGFKEFCERERSRAEGGSMPEGYVAETVLWLVEGEVYIGRVSIRHTLTQKLQQTGGHIGYDIRPSMRRRGYGREILRLALPEAKKLGLERIMITCDATNIGSKRIIESNGGVLENEVPGENLGDPSKLRYWIAL
jgi:predicted acetyltransferase